MKLSAFVQFRNLLRSGRLSKSAGLKIILLSASICICASVKCPPSSAAPLTDLDCATKLYTAGKIDEAVKLLESVLQKNPRDASAHYLKGNCLVKLKRLPEAAHEYLLVAHLSPTSAIADHARRAAAQIDAIQLEIAKKPASTANGKAAPNGKLPPGTIELIRYQARLARERAIQQGQAEADDEVHKAESQGKAERERVERLANSGQSRTDQQAISGGDLAAMRNRAAEYAEQLKKVGEAKAAWKEQEAQEKAENLKLQAEELEAQLVEGDYKRRTVKLNPVGTNLYTRNYASAHPEIKHLDAQALILPDASTFKKTSGLLKTSQVSGKKAPAAVRSVRGNSGDRTETKLEGEVVRSSR